MILENVAHDSTEVCSTFTILRHVLVFANSMSELVLNLKEANERIEERMKVLAENLRHLRHRLEVHITSVREQGPNLSDPALTFLDASTIQPEVLIEVMLQQTPLVPPATGPKPISAVSSKCSEFPAEDIVCTGLKYCKSTQNYKRKQKWGSLL